MAKKPQSSPPVEIDFQIERLIRRANNPRTHSREQIAIAGAAWDEEMLRIEVLLILLSSRRPIQTDTSSPGTSLQRPGGASPNLFDPGALSSQAGPAGKRLLT